MQDAFASGNQRCRVLSRRQTFPASLDSVKVDIQIVQERMEDSDRIASSTDACNDSFRELTVCLEDLLPSLLPNHALKVPDHRRIRMWAHNRSQKIVRILNMCNPV